MPDTTITIRGVDPDAWREFQRGIVSLHGNLYGNIGQEVTKALRLWLERHYGREAAVGIPADRLSVSYDDVGGLKEEIKTIREMVEAPLRHPELFRWLNLIPPKGVLIHGPPGTGKNLLARVATWEARAQLYILSIQRVIGESNEMRLRGVFQRAKETAPSVILIPDLGVIADDRQRALGEQADHILSWLLSEIDGIEVFGRVVAIGIAHSPEDLAPSLRQRFQREVEVKLPDRQGRYEILTILTRKMPLADDVDVGRLADMTDGYQGALLWRVCQEAATQGLRRTLEQEEIGEEEIPKEKLERIKVGMDDFLNALNSAQPET